MMGQPPPPIAPPAKGKRRKGLIIFGIILFVGGLLGGGAIVAKGMSNYKDAVKSLARAPVGCTTTLVFDKPATFIVYAETKGKLGDLGGDCEANDGTYEHSGDKLPKVSLTLEDPDGTPVDLARGVTASYDVDDYVGTALRTMKIEQAGTYHLSVESDETDFAVAVGKDPKKDSETLTAIGGGVALGGLVIGLLLFLLGLRRRRPDVAPADDRPAAPMPGWPPAPYAVAPTSPPAPATYPGFQPAPPPLVGPGEPPMRPPEQPTGGFAPPTFAPPPPPTAAPPSSVPPLPTGPPTRPPVGAPTYPPPTGETPAIESPPVDSPSPPSVWAIPEDPKD